MSSHITKNQSARVLTVAAAQTNQVVSKVYHVSDRDSVCYSVDIIYSDAVVAVAITAKVQSSPDGGTTWIDAKTVALTAATATATRKTISADINIAGDQALLPLRSLARVVVTTGAGDSITIDSIWVSCRTNR